MSKILKTIIVVVFSNLIALLAWTWFYMEINSSALRINVLRQEISVADAKQKNIKLLIQTLEEVSAQRSKVSAVFTDEKNIIQFIEELEETAFKSGVSLEIPSASLPVKEEDGGPSFVLNFSGDFGNVLKFLTAVEKMNYQLQTESSRLNVPENDVKWDAQMRVRLLSYQF